MSDNSNRRTSDAQVGYLTGRIESIEARLNAHMKREEEVQHEIYKKLEKITEQLSMYRHLTFFLRTVGIIIAALLAAKWGAVKLAWLSFVNGSV